MYKLQMITETQKIELKCKSRSVLMPASDLNFCALRPCPPETLRFDGLFNGTRRAVHDDGASRAAKRAAEPADGVRATMLQQLRKFSGLAAVVRAGVDISTRFLRRLPFDRVVDVAPRVNVSQHIFQNYPGGGSRVRLHSISGARRVREASRAKPPFEKGETVPVPVSSNRSERKLRVNYL